MQPKFVTLLPTSLINLNKYNECKKKFVLPCLCELICAGMYGLANFLMVHIKDLTFTVKSNTVIYYLTTVKQKVLKKTEIQPHLNWEMLALT